MRSCCVSLIFQAKRPSFFRLTSDLDVPLNGIGTNLSLKFCRQSFHSGFNISNDTESGRFIMAEIIRILRDVIELDAFWNRIPGGIDNCDQRLSSQAEHAIVLTENFGYFFGGRRQRTAPERIDRGEVVRGGPG